MQLAWSCFPSRDRVGKQVWQWCVYVDAAGHPNPTIASGYEPSRELAESRGRMEHKLATACKETE